MPYGNYLRKRAGIILSLQLVAEFTSAYTGGGDYTRFSWLAVLTAIFFLDMARTFYSWGHKKGWVAGHMTGYEMGLTNRHRLFDTEPQT